MLVFGLCHIKFIVAKGPEYQRLQSSVDDREKQEGEEKEIKWNANDMLLSQRKDSYQSNNKLSFTDKCE